MRQCPATTGGGTFPSPRSQSRPRSVRRVRPTSRRVAPSGTIWRRRSVSELLVRASPPATDGTLLRVTPASAGWRHVGFEVLELAPGRRAVRATDGQEVCVVVVSGQASVRSEHGDWSIGGRGRRTPSIYLAPPSLWWRERARSPSAGLPRRAEARLRVHCRARRWRLRFEATERSSAGSIPS